MFITEKRELAQYRSPYRIWQGIPGIVVTQKGRIFITFYSGETRETFGNYCMLVQSEEGANFSEPIAVAAPDNGRCYDPCLWIDPLGRLWFLWSYMSKENEGVYAAICDEPDAETLVWKEPVFIGNDVMINKPTVLTTGEWLFPIAVWEKKLHDLLVDYSSAETERGSFAYKSIDNGASFIKYGKAEVEKRSFDEHMILELNDGRLAMYVRTNYGIAVSYSYDRGKTWTKGVDSGLCGPCSRFFIRRLKSGRILLINHYLYTGRNNLTALLSEDEGKTWKYHLLLDERKNVSYPDAMEDEQGNIHIVYDRERGCLKNSLEQVYASAREILYAKITEEDIIAGALVNPQSKLKQIVSKLDHYAYEAQNPFREYQRFSDAELVDFLLQKDEKNIIGSIFEACPLHCEYFTEELNRRLDVLAASLNRKFTKNKAVELVSLLRSIVAQTEQEYPVVSTVKNILSDSLQDNVSVKEIAKKANVSEYYLMHLFKKQTGTTIVAYRNALRLARAKKLLIDSDRTIAWIATECGFDTASYFAEQFKKEEGVSPSEYRKLLSNYH